MALDHAVKRFADAKVDIVRVGANSSVSALAITQMDSSGAIAAGGGGGSTQVSIKEILTSSGASVMDSTLNAVRITSADAGGSTQVSVSGNTYDSSGALQVNTGPGGSTQISVSTGSVRVHQSTAADLNAAVVQGSTIWAAQVSSVAGRVLVEQNSTVWPVQVPSSQSIQVKNSTIGDLLASVQQNSTVWAVQVADYVAPSTTIQVSSVSGRVRAQNSTIGDLLASVQQNSTVWEVQSRQTLPTLLSTAFSTLGNNSTSSTIVSSQAGLRHKVFAYSITSTAQPMAHGVVA